MILNKKIIFLLISFLYYLNKLIVALIKKFVDNVNLATA